MQQCLCFEDISTDLSGEKIGWVAESFITPISGEQCCSAPRRPHKTPPPRLVSNFPHSNLSKISDEILLISQIGGLYVGGFLFACSDTRCGWKPEKDLACSSTSPEFLTQQGALKSFLTQSPALFHLGGDHPNWEA